MRGHLISKLFNVWEPPIRKSFKKIYWKRSGQIGQNGNKITKAEIMKIQSPNDRTVEEIEVKQ